MFTYLVRRFAQMLGSILLGSFVAYTVLLYIPGGGLKEIYDTYSQNPANVQTAAQTQQMLTDLQQEFKVDKPLPLGYLLWLFDPNVTTERDYNLDTVPIGIDLHLGSLHIHGAGALTGNLGYSESRGDTGAPTDRGKAVVQLIGDTWGNTLLLVVLSFPISILVAILIGVVGAVRRGTKLDTSLTFLSFAGLSVPQFALGLIFIIFLAIVPKILHDQAGWTWLPYLPAGDSASSGQESSLIDHIYHALLPAATLSLALIATLSRYVRFSMLDVLRQDYIRTARAKGLPPSRVIFKHALKNAILPVITIVGLSLPALVTGAIVVEQVFGYYGMGQLFFQSVGGCIPSENDFATLMCRPIGGPMDTPTTLVLLNILIILVAVSNMLADIFYAVADPRIGRSYREGQ